MNCLNCETSFEGKFCPECGQNSSITKITFDFLVSDFLTKFLDMDRGILYNLKYLTIAPKKIILNYINGKRKNVFNPVSYAVIAITLFLIIESQLKTKIINETNLIAEPKTAIYSFSYEAGKLIRGYIKFFWLLNILLLSLFTKLFFKKINFFEHLAMNCFIIGHATLIGILSFLIFRIPLIFDPLVFVYIVFLIFMVFQTKGTRFETSAASFFSVLFGYLLFYSIPLIITGITT